MIAVVDYHKGNLKSVERGLIGVGADARITDDPDQIASADAIVLPGVGAFLRFGKIERGGWLSYHSAGKQFADPAHRPLAAPDHQQRSDDVAHHVV